MLKELLGFLRGEFDRVPSLSHRLDQLDQQIVRLTENQYRILDAVWENPRILVNGGAGTGKTFLAMETARRHADAGQSVLFLCRNPNLATFLQRQLLGSLVHVCHFDLSTRLDQRFHVLVVDEFQDLLAPDLFLSLDDLVEGGLAHGICRFFGDLDNQRLFDAIDDNTALDLLSEDHYFRYKLTDNCRNTSQIVLATGIMTGAEMGDPMNQGDGEKAEKHPYSSSTNRNQQLRQIIEGLLANDLAPGNISLLTIGMPVVGLLPVLTDISSVRLSTDLVRQGLPDNILIMARAEDYKGLENQVVILVIDGNFIPDDLQKFKSLVYVGASRARNQLIVLVDRRLEPLLN